MLDIIAALNIDPALFAKILPIVLLTMGILSGISIVLNAIAKATKSEGDDKLAAKLQKILGFGQKIVDFISGNVKH